MSSWDTLAGAGVNAVTDIVMGFVDTTKPKGTPIIKAWDSMIIPAFSAGWDGANWEQFGQGLMQFLASLIKFENVTNYEGQKATTV